MHKHPTPIVIKNEVLKEMIKTAQINGISASIVGKMIMALNTGIKNANASHDLLKEFLDPKEPLITDFNLEDLFDV